MRMKSAFAVAHYLWNRFWQPPSRAFCGDNFEPVVGEILEKAGRRPDGRGAQTYVMVRAASKVAERYVAAATLVTGDAGPEVSSQTLTNLRCDR